MSVSRPARETRREALLNRVGAWCCIRAAEMEQRRLAHLPKCPECELWPDVPGEDCPICEDRDRQQRIYAEPEWCP